MLRESLAQISGKAKKIIATVKVLVLCHISLTLIACEQPNVSAPTSLYALPEAQKNNASNLWKISDVPGGESWYKLQFANERDGWLADNRNIWRTVDGGISWEVVYSINRPENLPPHIPAHRLKEYADAFREIETFHFMNALQGLLQTSGGTYKTEDSGKTWTKIATPLDFPKGQIREVKFLKDSKVGWIAGGIYRTAPRETMLKAPSNAVSPDSKSVLYGAIFRTDDGGITWSQQLVTSEMGKLLRLYFVDTEHGWAVGDIGVFHTRNGGKQWKASNLNDECARSKLLEEYREYPSNIFFIDKTTGWLSYKDGYIANSIDGGQTWCSLWQPQNTYFRNIYFADSTHGWGLAVDGSMHKTIDGGVTWMRIDTGIRFEDMYFLDPSHGWLVSKEGLFRINS